MPTLKRALVGQHHRRYCDSGLGAVTGQCIHHSIVNTADPVARSQQYMCLMFLSQPSCTSLGLLISSIVICRAFARGALRAVAYCHKRGIAHGSLGSGSFVVSTFDDRRADSLIVKITNFGFAQRWSQAPEGTQSGLLRIGFHELKPTRDSRTSMALHKVSGIQ